MTYKKDDILIFMTNEPMAHACEIVGEPMDKSEIEKEEYYGFVKSVISHKDGIYLMHTIKPLREIICIAEAADIIRKVDPCGKTTKTNSSLSAKATNVIRYFVGR